MEKLLGFLESIHPMSDGLKQHLATILKVKQLPKKDYLLRSGQISKKICFIGQGGDSVQRGHLILSDVDHCVLL